MLLQYRNINFNISLINISQRHLLYTPLFYSKLLLKFFVYFFSLFSVFFFFCYASGTCSHSSDLASNFFLTLSLSLTILFLISFTTGYVPPWESISFLLIANKTVRSSSTKFLQNICL